jgi:kynurenine formamidase
MADPDDAAYDEVRRLGKELSNWGRWGADDELGTLNLIDAAAVRRGAAAVRDGVAVSLALELGHGGPHTNELYGRFNPQHYMTAIGQAVPVSPTFHFSDDIVTMPLNAATQWDSLAHVYYDGQLYNGFPAHTLNAEVGATRAGIDRQAACGFATRGVLLDVARARGVDRLGPGEAIGADELDSIAVEAGVIVEPGDIVLVRTGFIRTFTVDGDRRAYNGSAPGPGMSILAWLHAHDVAAVATDTMAFEVGPSEDGATICPVHLVAIRDLGMPLGEMFDLERLSVECDRAGRWQFQLVAPPLPFTGGISSPLNPIAIL